VVIDSGMTRLDAHGWEQGSVSTETFEICDDDPNSNKASVHWSTRCNRPQMSVGTRTETNSSLASTPTEFLFRASLEAFEGEERIYVKQWEERFPRDLN